MSEVVPGLVWLVVLLAANAFFVGAEFAVVTARRSQVEPLAEGGSRAARTTLWAMEHATLMLATSQLGITICSLLILNVSEPAIHHLFELALGPTGLSDRHRRAGVVRGRAAAGDLPARGAGRDGPQEPVLLRAHPRGAAARAAAGPGLAGPAARSSGR